MSSSSSGGTIHHVHAAMQANRAFQSINQLFRSQKMTTTSSPTGAQADSSVESHHKFHAHDDVLHRETRYAHESELMMSIPREDQSTGDDQTQQQKQHVMRKRKLGRGDGDASEKKNSADQQQQQQQQPTSFHIHLLHRIMNEGMMNEVNSQMHVPEHFFHALLDKSDDDDHTLSDLRFDRLNKLHDNMTNVDARRQQTNYDNVDSAAVMLNKFVSLGRMHRQAQSDEQTTQSFVQLSDIGDRKITSRKTMKKVADAYAQQQQKLSKKGIQYCTPTAGRDMAATNSDTTTKDADPNCNTTAPSQSHTEPSSANKGQERSVTSGKTGKNKHTNKSDKPMSSRDKKQRKLFSIKEQEHRYEDYLPLHALWKQYILEMLSSASGSSSSALLMKADYHGCIFKVERSKCPSYVGTEGIMIQETENTFRLVTRDNKLKTIFKSGTVFTFELSSPEITKDYVITIYGNNFRYRSFDRSARKFKTKDSIDI